MKEFKLLKMLDKLQHIFEAYGINYAVMRKIIQVKLVMDERRVPTIMMGGKKVEENKNSYRSSLIVYFIMGAFIGAFMFMPLPLFMKMNLVLGMLIFMIMTTMISDFSSVLLDIEDKNILLPKPVDAKTLNMAKIIHILYYLISISIAIAGGTLVFGGIKHGIGFSIIMLVELFLICGFVILFTSIFYYIILTFFSGEKLKDIINYFQIALTIFMTLVYQLMGRVFSFAEVNVKNVTHTWDFFLPTAWFAAPFSFILEKDGSRHIILLSIMGILIPLLTILVYVKFVIPHFEQNLQKLNGNDKAIQSNKMNKFSRKLSNFFCKTPIEKIFFRFSYIMLGNERKLKLRIYPMVVFAFLFPFLFILNQFDRGQSISETFARISTGNYYLYLYYSIGFMSSLFYMVSLSENYQGAWIYKVLPIDKPSEVIKGAFKAFLYKYVIWQWIITSIIFTVVFGVKIIPDEVLIWMHMLLLMLVNFTFSKKELPFYKDFQYAQNGNTTVRVFMSFAICGVFALLHFLFRMWGIVGFYSYMAIVMVIIIVLWDLSFSFTWEDIKEI